MAFKVGGVVAVDDDNNLSAALDKYIVSDTLEFEVPKPFQFQGTTSGYSSGGNAASPASWSDVIDKFPFSTDTNAADVGNLSQGRNSVSGQSSTESGYTSGGAAPPATPPTLANTIDKFPFSADANATDVGDLSQARNGTAGQSSAASGYVSGGLSPVASPIRVNTIDKFPFSADANATDVGDLTQGRSSIPAGQSSTEYGYTSGGISGPPNIYETTIDKFPFSVDANATDVGDLTQGRSESGGQSSAESGYNSGGFFSPPSAYLNTIDKFPFAADANATDVGDLIQARAVGADQSSAESGYSSGGTAPSYNNTIDKFPFASDANATDVGDLTQSRRFAAGQQV